ncbi:hypothetical protein [Streptomyces sp. NPDC002587]
MLMLAAATALISGGVILPASAATPSLSHSTAAAGVSNGDVNPGDTHGEAPGADSSADHGADHGADPGADHGADPGDDNGADGLFGGGGGAAGDAATDRKGDDSLRAPHSGGDVTIDDVNDDHNDGDLFDRWDDVNWNRWGLDEQTVDQEEF